LSNIFDTANYPNQIPAVLQVNGYWAWKRTDLSVEYPTALYSLTYKLHLISGSTAATITINATESNNDYIFTHTSTNSVTPGDYKWVAKIIRTSDGAEGHIGEGFLSVESDAVRSYNKQCLDAIEAVMLNKASMDQASMSIAGRSLSRTPWTELKDMHELYDRKVKAEIKRARIKNGGRSGNNVPVSFGSIKTPNPTDY
jgi:hypothetical protein|tara:strand:- start:1518 stop:2114 length:597 start_codon:yes stop_codon:yes gene_type:complete